MSNFQGSKLSPLVSLYLLAQAVTVFSHTTLINLLVAVLASPTDAVYQALTEELKLESSEVKITLKPLEHITSEEGTPNVFKLAILDYLNAKDTDLLALPALCLLMVLMKNKGAFHLPSLARVSYSHSEHLFSSHRSISGSIMWS